ILREQNKFQYSSITLQVYSFPFISHFQCNKRMVEYQFWNTIEENTVLCKRMIISHNCHALNIKYICCAN
ncbi:hypothetical protein VIGAN_07003100, partial [Vigna angularis var. angularis]